MIGVGGYVIIRHLEPRFTLGTLLMFRAYWWRLFGPVMTLARVNDMVQRGGAAGRRVFEVLDAPEELPDAAGCGGGATHIDGKMELRDVSFAYARIFPTNPSRAC